MLWGNAMTPAIQIENLGLSLTGSTILSDLSIKIQPGEFVSIVGPNGAGKTSLIKCLARIHANWTGNVRIDGNDLNALPQRSLAKQVSYVPQAEGRRLPFTVNEFVLMGRYPHLSPFSSVSAEDKVAAREALATAGAERFAHRQLDTLSGGERQMVFIAAALAQGASIMLLDEPTAFLDYRHQVEVATLLTRLHREQGITILSVSHDINAACTQSDRVVALKHGTVFFDGPPADIVKRGVLEDLYEAPFTYTPSNTHALPIITPGGAA